MTKTRNLSDLLDANGDVKLGNLDNVPASNDASALTTGTLPIARIADGDIALAKLSATGTKDATTFLRGDNTFAEAGGGGKVLQVIMGTNNSYQTSTTSSSLTDVLSASGTTWETAITPSATSSKILVLPSVYVRGHTNSGNEARGHINMMTKTASGSYANIDEGYEFTGGYDYGGSGLIIAKFYNPIILYTSNTTDEVKFKFQIATDGGTVTVDWGPAGVPQLTSRVVLMEIGA
jgi:hypothetical protein